MPPPFTLCRGCKTTQHPHSPTIATSSARKTNPRASCKLLPKSFRAGGLLDYLPRTRLPPWPTTVEHTHIDPNTKHEIRNLTWIFVLASLILEGLLHQGLVPQASDQSLFEPFWFTSYGLERRNLPHSPGNTMIRRREGASERCSKGRVLQRCAQGQRRKGRGEGEGEVDVDGCNRASLRGLSETAPSLGFFSSLGELARRVSTKEHPQSCPGWAP